MPYRIKIDNQEWLATAIEFDESKLFGIDNRTVLRCNPKVILSDAVTNGEPYGDTKIPLEGKAFTIEHYQYARDESDS